MIFDAHRRKWEERGAKKNSPGSQRATKIQEGSPFSDPVWLKSGVKKKKIKENSRSRHAGEKPWEKKKKKVAVQILYPKGEFVDKTVHECPNIEQQLIPDFHRSRKGGKNLNILFGGRGNPRKTGEAIC